jgi:hypothetical protein
MPIDDCPHFMEEGAENLVYLASGTQHITNGAGISVEVL